MGERPGHNPEVQQPKEERRPSSKRLMLAFEALLKTQAGKVEVRGTEHLAEIPRDRKIIVATSHISDIDIPLSVKAVGYDLDLAIVNESVHHSFRQEPSTNFGLHVAGKDNFIPLDFKKTEKGKRPLPFNPENFQPMEQALEKGKAILIAAHNPSWNWQLEEGGYGAVYLAELSDAVIIPVGVNIKSKKPLGMYDNPAETLKERPDAEVKIGAPFELEKIEGIEDMAKIFAKMKAGEKLTRDEHARISELHEQLRKQSDIVMQRIAELVPEEKRGIYKKGSPTSDEHE